MDLNQPINVRQELPQVASPPFTTIELFAGAGGLALGVEKAGFQTIGLIEFDKDAADTLKKNRPNWNVICDDIANISPLNLPANWTCFPAARPARHFPTPESVLGWKMRAGRFFITTQYS